MAQANAAAFLRQRLRIRVRREPNDTRSSISFQMDAGDHVTIADRPWHVGPRIAQRPALAEPLQHPSLCAVGNPIAAGILVAQQRDDRRDRYVEHHAGANLRMGRALHGPNRHLDPVPVATHLPGGALVFGEHGRTACAEQDEQGDESALDDDASGRRECVSTQTVREGAHQLNQPEAPDWKSIALDERMVKGEGGASTLQRRRPPGARQAARSAGRLEWLKQAL